MASCTAILANNSTARIVGDQEKGELTMQAAATLLIIAACFVLASKGFITHAWLLFGVTLLVNTVIVEGREQDGAN